MSSKLWVLRMMAVVGLAAMLVTSLAGCSQTPTVAPTTPPLPTASPQPTVNPQPTYNAIQTQAAQTVIANLTQNAPTASPIKPTSTAAATHTPVAATSTTAPTAFFTATSVLATQKASATVASATAVADGYGCTLLSVLPRYSDDVNPSTDFDAYWTVLNSGLETWTPQDVVVRFVSGVNLQKNSNKIAFNTVVRRGEKYTVGIDMLAPADPGVYQSNWALTHGRTTLCALNLTIVVRNPNPTSTPQP